jgi:hypothetical protein
VLLFAASTSFQQLPVVIHCILPRVHSKRKHSSVKLNVPHYVLVLYV